MIHVLDGGLSTTVQDLGRFGYYHIGMPPSGAMDQFSHRVANALVGNDENAATLEMTYMGPTLEFTEDAVIALSGAQMGAELAGDPLPMNEAVAVEAGEELSLEYATNGTRTYLAVAGGVNVEPLMESRSTYTLIGIGGLEGRALEAGDELAVGQSATAASTQVGQSVDDDLLYDYAEEDTIRIVVGLCDYRLTEQGRADLLNAEWTVKPDADRVGYRLDGPDLEFIERDQSFGAGTDLTNVVDLGYPVGSIQIAGQPIVLMQDAVTGGGYATVGTVISTDRNLLAQRPTHQSVYFESVDIEEALAARESERERLDSILVSLD